MFRVLGYIQLHTNSKNSLLWAVVVAVVVVVVNNVTSRNKHGRGTMGKAGEERLGRAKGKILVQQLWIRKRSILLEGCPPPTVNSRHPKGFTCSFSTCSFSLCDPSFHPFIFLFSFSVHTSHFSPQRPYTTPQWISHHSPSSRCTMITPRASCPIHMPCTRRKSKILVIQASCTHSSTHTIKSCPPDPPRVGFHCLCHLPYPM